MIGATSSKVEQYRDTQVTDGMASSLAKKTRSFSTVDADKACSDGGSGKNKCSNDTSYSESRFGTTQLLCYEDGQRKKLL